MRLRSSVRIAIGLYLAMVLIGIVVTILAANARSDSAYWSVSRALGFSRQSLSVGLYPGLAFIAVGAVGAYRCLNAGSSRRHRRKQGSGPRA